MAGPMKRLVRVWLVGLSFLLGLPALAQAGPVEITLLYTNDVHDHLMPDDSGIGGLVYVSGYVSSVREAVPNVILIDAGDATEKGDLIAYLTGSEITMEAFGRMNYDAIAVGNHEHNFGLDQVRRFNDLSGGVMLAANLVDEDGLLFPASRIIERGGASIGVIGAALPRGRDTLTFDETGEALRRISEELRFEQEVGLIIATVHVGVEDAAEWSRMAPEIDIFISGHTHQLLTEPVMLDETGTVILQAGSNARHVGRVELSVGNGPASILSSDIIPMDHAAITVDEEMLEWIMERSAEVLPDIQFTEFTVRKPVGWFALARLSAEAIRTHSDAEIAFFHPTHLVRNILRPGPVSLNGLFRTSADRGHALLTAELTGAEISFYLNGLMQRDYSDWGQTMWAGFAVTELREDGTKTTDLDPDRLYTVIMPAQEWEKRFLRLVERTDEAARASVRPITELSHAPAGFATIEALAPFLSGIVESGDTLEARLNELKSRQGIIDPMEMVLEAAIIHRQLN